MKDILVGTVARRDEAAASIWRLALKQTKPLVVLNAGDVGPPLYCIHPVTGDIIGLREFASLLKHKRVVGIQVPRESMNGEFASSIEILATRYVELIQKAEPEGPIALVGWSAGAIIALEMAQRFRDAGREVSLLVALDGAPCNTGAGIKPTNPLYILRLLLNLPRWFKDERLQDWTPSAIARRIEGKVAYRFGLRAPSIVRGVDTIDAETIQNLENTNGWSDDQKSFMHAMYKSMINYTPRPYHGRIVVYETKTQPLYHLRQIGAAWKSIARQAEIVRLDGSHIKLVEQPIIGAIVGDLLNRLAVHADGSALTSKRYSCSGLGELARTATDGLPIKERSPTMAL